MSMVWNRSAPSFLYLVELNISQYDTSFGEYSNFLITLRFHTIYKVFP